VLNSLPKTVTRQRRGYDLNPGPSAPESSTLTKNKCIGHAMLNVCGTVQDKMKVISPKCS